MTGAPSQSDNDNSSDEPFDILVEGGVVWIHWPGRDASVLLGRADHVFGKFTEKMAEMAFESS